MLSTPIIKAAEALYPLLSVFHEVDGNVLDAVSEINELDMITQIRLHFGLKHLVVRAEPEFDTADLSVQTQYTGGEEISNRQPWSDVVGKQFGWGWVTVNQQGYLDGILLSFDGIVPEILISVVASEIKVRKIA